jgi:hypothetical protein
MSEALSVEIRERLGKLLLMLSSSHDGERAAAAAAIDRALRANGLSWHDLVGAINAPPPPQHKNGGAAWKRSDGPTDVERDQMLALLDAIDERCTFLSAKSRSFVDTLRKRTRYRPKVHLSSKQWAWLQDLMEKADT